MTNNKEKEGGFISHLTELRQRLINSLIFLAILFVICYFFSEYIYGFLVEPYANAVKNYDIVTWSMYLLVNCENKSLGMIERNR